MPTCFVIWEPVPSLRNELLVGGTDRLRSPSFPRRAGDRLPADCAGVGAAALARSGQDRSALCTQAPRLLAGGLLEPIHVPSCELEAGRDLVRAREDARLDRMRDRQRLSKFCLRHGRLLPTSAWTVSRRTWLGQQRFEHAAQQLTFDTYLHALD